MNIDDLVTIKKQLELDIHKSLSKAIADFQSASGMGIESIDIDFIKNHQIGKEKPELIVGNLKVNILL